jgi:hypothetical protein
MTSSHQLALAMFLSTTGCQLVMGWEETTVALDTTDAGAEGSPSNPVCDSVVEAIDQKRTSLSMCNPQQDFPNLPCQHTYFDECDCSQATSDIIAISNYNNLVSAYRDAGCDAGCSVCLYEGGLWECQPDQSGTSGTCVPAP